MEFGRDRGYGYSSSKAGRSSKSRRRNDSEDVHQPERLIDEMSPIIEAFQCFQQELDSRYDKYETLVKYSRDITIESKRIIFSLHRIVSEKERVLLETENRLKQLQRTSLRSIAKELKNEDFYMYLRAYSPGLQEYIEAITFFHYIKSGRLANLDEIQADLIYNEETERIEDGNHEVEGSQLILTVPPLEYILGVADLTGELMRKCINSVGQGDLKEPFVLCAFLQQIHDAFGLLGNVPGREIGRKIFTLRQNLKKVENACYAIQVRGKEIPKCMLTDVFATETEETE